MSWKLINDLVNKSEQENKIDAEIKKQLGILGESCTQHPWEGCYVVFSQFPVGNGVVDFAVFTGPSRLTITLIEVKGSNFFFENTNGSPHADITEAYVQILSRFAHYRDDYRQFRDNAHACLVEAQAGSYKGNYFVGLNGKNMEVDSNKDVVIRGLVIGGRTRDDVSESNLRSSLERVNSNIKFESWPSWLRKRGSVSGELRDQPIPVETPSTPN